MVEEILALSWGTIFWFSLKVMSAWVLATLIVYIPLGVISFITGD